MALYVIAEEREMKDVTGTGREIDVGVGCLKK
jgi:hypothetical protein